MRDRLRYRRDATSPVQPVKPENQAVAAVSDDKERDRSAAALIISGDKEKSENQATAFNISIVNESKKEGESSVDDAKTIVPVLQVSAAAEVEQTAGNEMKGSADNVDATVSRYNKIELIQCSYMMRLHAVSLQLAVLVKK